MNHPPSTASAFQTDLGWMGIVWTASPDDHNGPSDGHDLNSEPLSPKTPADWRVFRLTFGHTSRQAMLDHLQFLDAGQSLVVKSLHHRNDCSRSQAETIDRICAYSAGEPLSLTTIPVAIDDRTPFQQAVLSGCRAVPWGEKRTYAELADDAGHPRSARAVGNVMANNRTPLLIPCHRIVPSGTGRPKLGGFTAPGGVAMKQRLLDLESGTQSWIACS